MLSFTETTTALSTNDREPSFIFFEHPIVNHLVYPVMVRPIFGYFVVVNRWPNFIGYGDINLR